MAIARFNARVSTKKQRTEFEHQLEVFNRRMRKKYPGTELYGKFTTLPWGVIFKNAGNLPRHPSQIYEAVLEGIVLFLIINYLALKKELLYKTGYVSAIFLIFYSILRIFSEIFREPDIQIGLIFNYFSMGSILSILTITVGLLIILFLKQNEQNN